MKTTLDKIAKSIPPWIWFIMSLISGIATVFTFCLGMKLGGAQFLAGYSFFLGGMEDMAALFVFIYGCLFSSCFYFGKSSYTFYKQALESAGNT